MNSVGLLDIRAEAQVCFGKILCDNCSSVALRVSFHTLLCHKILSCYCFVMLSLAFILPTRSVDEADLSQSALHGQTGVRAHCAISLAHTLIHPHHVSYALLILAEVGLYIYTARLCSGTFPSPFSSLAAPLMVNQSLTRIALTVFSLTTWTHSEPLDFQIPLAVSHPAPEATKSIAIIGAGSGGLAALKTLLDLPEEPRRSWDIVLYEQRSDVGGLWFADPVAPHPPTLPETPLYPRLRTNTPHPTMTYPGFTFPPNTPLFPTHEYVWKYHVDFAERYNLGSFIHLNHTVLAAGWNGTRADGKWVVDVEHAEQRGVRLRRTFDHLIVANGHNHYPRVPQWAGENEWLENTPEGTPKREILHSIFYREPERYINRTVLIVGGGASGRDAALQVGPLTKVRRLLERYWKTCTLKPNMTDVSIAEEREFSTRWGSGDCRATDRTLHAFFHCF